MRLKGAAVLEFGAVQRVVNQLAYRRRLSVGGRAKDRTAPYAQWLAARDFPQILNNVKHSQAVPDFALYAMRCTRVCALDNPAVGGTQER